MKAKSYLQALNRLDSLIDNKLAEQSALRDMVTRITATIKDDVVSGGGTHDKIGDAVSRIVDLEREITAAIDTYVDRQREAAALLEKLEDDRFYNVLHKRYLQKMQWEEIANSVGCELRNVHNIHGNALAAFDKILQENCECS